MNFSTKAGSYTKAKKETQSMPVRQVHEKFFYQHTHGGDHEKVHLTALSMEWANTHEFQVRNALMLEQKLHQQL